MEHLKNVLSKTFQATWKIKLLTEWPQIMGNLSDKVSLEKIYEDTLVLGVTNACLLQELYLLSPVLLKTINEHLATPRIKTVRFKHSSKQEKVLVDKVVAPPVVVKTKQLLQPKERQALQLIHDADLKHALHLFLEALPSRIKQ